MNKRDIAHNLHLFLDTVNAPAKAIFDTVNGVCKQLNAEVLVMAANHKVRPQIAGLFACASASRIRNPV